MCTLGLKVKSYSSNIKVTGEQINNIGYFKILLRASVFVWNLIICCLCVCVCVFVFVWLCLDNDVIGFYNELYQGNSRPQFHVVLYLFLCNITHFYIALDVFYFSN